MLEAAFFRDAAAISGGENSRVFAEFSASCVIPIADSNIRAIAFS
jgi:hypothetical protein